MANPPMTGLEEVERDHIVRALEASNWVVGGHNGCTLRDEEDIVGLQNAKDSHPPSSTAFSRDEGAIEARQLMDVRRISVNLEV